MRSFVLRNKITHGSDEASADSPSQRHGSSGNRKYQPIPSIRATGDHNISRPDDVLAPLLRFTIGLPSRKRDDFECGAHTAIRVGEMLLIIIKGGKYHRPARSMLS